MLSLPSHCQLLVIDEADFVASNNKFAPAVIDIKKCVCSMLGAPSLTSRTARLTHWVFLQAHAQGRPCDAVLSDV